jgi:hypothetical protein
MFLNNQLPWISFPIDQYCVKYFGCFSLKNWVALGSISKGYVHCITCELEMFIENWTMDENGIESDRS